LYPANLNKSSRATPILKTIFSYDTITLQMKVFFNIQMTMMRFLKHTPLLLWLAIALGGCNVGPNASPSDKLAVVATHSILGDLVQQIGGTAIDLTVLVGPDGDTHTFEPSPADGVHLTKSKFDFENGMGFEPWLTDLYSATNSQAQQVVISAAITPRMIANSEQGDVDPHIWHSVPNAQLMVQAIQAELVSADPAHATVYNANADAYQAQLAELDGWIRTQVATIPPANRKLVTSHDTFGYFAETYALKYLAQQLGHSVPKVVMQMPRKLPHWSPKFVRLAFLQFSQKHPQPPIDGTNRPRNRRYASARPIHRCARRTGQRWG
jgi:ABC-type Zn uptake system ZnuABC Zn-binding protein ZnuA